MEINLYNVEEKIFSNSELQKKLPDFKEVFDQWKFAKMVGGMASKLREMEISFINAIDQRHVDVLNTHFECVVIVKKINNNITKSFQFSIHDCEIPIETKEYREFCVSRGKDGFNLTLWR